MRMLCLCAKSEPVGYLRVAGKALTEDDLASLVGKPARQIKELLQELEEHGVFSRDASGCVYSRRMVRDAEKAAMAREHGRRGGNPNLMRRHNGQDNRGVNGRDKPHSHEP